MSKEPKINGQPGVLERAKINRSLRDMPRARKLKLCQKLFPADLQQVRADFVVFDTSGWPGFKADTVILHLPSMLWRGFDVSFATALEWLEDESTHQELVSSIFELTP